MAMMFIDGFDEYSFPAQKWTGVGAGSQGQNDLTGTLSRTGRGCYNTTGPFGPYFSFVARNHIIMGVAVNGGPFIFQAISGGAANVNTVNQMTVVTTGTGGVQAYNSGNKVNEFSAPGILLSGYNYVELDIHITGVGVGNFTVRVNGAVVINKTGVNVDPAGSGLIDTVQLLGSAGGSSCIFDDFYLFDSTGSTNNSLAGAVRVYTALPVSDSTPLQWTPSGGSAHFSLVNGVPAENQTTYVYDGTVGNIDDYLYDITGVPGGLQILGVQHGLYAELDSAGSGSIGSDCQGNAEGSVAMSTSPHLFTFERDTDPVVAGPWTLANLATRSFGPKRTA